MSYRLPRLRSLDGAMGPILVWIWQYIIRSRLKKLFAFGANFNPSGAKETVETDKNFAQFFEVAAQDYRRLSATPDGFDHFVGQVSEMWESGPNFTRRAAFIHYYSRRHIRRRE